MTENKDPDHPGDAVHPADVVLEVEGLHKWFGGLHALDDVSFRIGRGETVGLVGDNGAGKSTLLKSLSGVHQPTSGTIKIDEAEIALSSPAVARRHGIETVYQDLALIGRFTIAENFFLGRELRSCGIMRKRAMRQATDQALSSLDVRVPFANRRVSKMSGGQRQAVAIARGAYWGTKVLLLDEPTAALGVRESGEVLALLQSLKASGLTQILVTHNIDHLWTVCSRVLILRRGRLVADVMRDAVSPSEVVAHITGASEATIAAATAAAMPAHHRPDVVAATAERNHSTSATIQRPQPFEPQQLEPAQPLNEVND